MRSNSDLFRPIQIGLLWLSDSRGAVYGPHLTREGLPWLNRGRGAEKLLGFAVEQRPQTVDADGRADWDIEKV